MKASELRIGNWIKDRGSKQWQIDCWESKNKVAAKSPVLGYCDFTKNQIEGHPLTEEIDYLQPIQLTEEWLLKFGFYQDIEDDRYLEFKIENDKWNRTLTVQKGEKEFMVSNRFDEWIICGECEFVHQLQNLYFALTQTELK